MKHNSPHFDLNKLAELKSKIIYTILCLMLCRFGSYVPLPGVDTILLNKLMEANAEGILGMFNMLSGGSLGRMSIFALAIMPYITASIILQLLTFMVKDLEALRKEGDRKRLNSYTKYLTVVISMVQSYAIVSALQKISANYGNIITISYGLFKFIAMISLMTGTMFLLWLGERITARGIGNGTSLIIFAGIIAGMPRAVAATIELGRAQVFSIGFIIILLGLIIGITAFIILFERAYRKISIQYARKQVGNKFHIRREASSMPLKLNTAGVIPPIFATSILLFPLTFVKFMGSSQGGVSEFINMHLAHGKFLYILLYIFFIIFFCFFYTTIVFNPDETAEHLRKQGAFIAGIKPGKATAEYLERILIRITVIGASYLAFICVLPEILIARYSIPFYLGGTGILIVVNVIMDTVMQVKAQLVPYQYEKLIRKSHL